MNVSELSPCPKERLVFTRDKRKFVPSNSGCYALVTLDGNVLYVGKSENLNRRFGEHLDNPQKTKPTDDGRAFFFYWWSCTNTSRIESTWQNECLITDGKLPILNVLISAVQS